MRTLIADQSKFDLALRNQAVLTPDEAFGRHLFETAQGAAASCRSCHGDVSLQSHTLGPGSAQPVYYNFGGTVTFHNIGMRPVEYDLGRAAVTGLTADRGRFKVPMLRNVGLQATLGHAGTYRSLADLVEFYDRGGAYHQNQSPQIQPRPMTPVERAALVAFLHTLADPRVASEQLPFDRPRLASENGASLPAVFGVATAAAWSSMPSG